MGFDMIIQNNASKQEYVIQGLTDKGNPMAYLFEDFEMPEGAQNGEYYGVLIWNGRDDVEYELKDVLLDTILHTSVGDVLLRDLRPEMFLLKYGTITNEVLSLDGDKEFLYYRK